MVFSDTTNKNGIIQRIEFWTGMNDGGISGAPTLLKQFTGMVNTAFDRVLPQLLALQGDLLRFDDTNHSDKPVGRVNIVSGQGDYKITQDDNSLNILNITNVRILGSSSATQYSELERMTLDDPDVPDVVSSVNSRPGTPTKFLETNNTVYLFPRPDYDATNGLQIFFERDPSYFASTDTTKEPGFPKPFHELLALYPALDWNQVNNANNQALIRNTQLQIEKYEKGLKELVEKRNPTKTVITPEFILWR